jgi:hypothetical protein
VIFTPVSLWGKATADWASRDCVSQSTDIIVTPHAVLKPLCTCQRLHERTEKHAMAAVALSTAISTHPISFSSDLSGHSATMILLTRFNACLHTPKRLGYRSFILEWAI